MTRQLIAIATLLAAPAAFAQTIHTVDARGRGDFLEIQPAIDAASEGDIVFIIDDLRQRGGSTAESLYSGFTVDGKSLSVVSEREADWNIGPDVVIRNLASSQSVVLKNLKLGNDETASNPDGARVRVEHCAGVVCFERCWIHGRDYAPALEAFSAGAVVLSRTRVRGALWGEAVVAESSLLTSDASVMVGGTGGAYPGCPSQPGPTGVILRDSELRAAGCQIWGGVGPVSQWCGGYLGDPVELIGNSRMVGPPETEALEAPELFATPVIAAGDDIAIGVHAQPGDDVYVVVSESLRAIRISDRVGTLFAGEPVPGGRRFVGTVEPSGELHASVPSAPSAPSGSARTLIVQVAAVGPAGVRLSGTREVIEVGPTAPILAPSEPAHVDPSAAPGGTGRSWASPFDSIEAAAAKMAVGEHAGAEIWLRGGRYLGTRYLREMRRVPAPVLIRGGFDGTEADPTQRDPSGPATVFDLDTLGDDGTPGGSLDDNAVSFFEGVNGYPTGISDGPWLAEDRPFRGLGLDRITFTGTTFYPGVNRLVGGTFDSVHSTDCRVEAVSGTKGVMGFTPYGPNRVDLRIERLTHLRNECPFVVGWFAAARASYTDCLFAGNQVGGYIIAVNERGLRSCTIVDNHTAGAEMVKVIDNGTGRGTIQNCVLFGNTSAVNFGFSAQLGGDIGDLGYSNIEGWIPSLGGAGMLAAAPMLMDRLGPDGIPGTGDEDYGPAPGSPLIDAGGPQEFGPSSLPASTLDLDRHPRRVDDPATPDTGPGPPPVIDIGAIEFDG